MFYHHCYNNIISQSGIIKVFLFYSILFYSILFYSILFYSLSLDIKHAACHQNMPLTNTFKFLVIYDDVVFEEKKDGTQN